MYRILYIVRIILYRRYSYCKVTHSSVGESDSKYPLAKADLNMISGKGQYGTKE